MDDLVVIGGLSILALIAHGSRFHGWLQWLLRSVYVLFLSGELIYLLVGSGDAGANSWAYNTTAGVAAATFLILFKPVRRSLSSVLTAVNQVVGGRVFLACAGRLVVAKEVRAVELAGSGGSASRVVSQASAAGESATQRLTLPPDAPASDQAPAEEAAGELRKTSPEVSDQAPSAREITEEGASSQTEAVSGLQSESLPAAEFGALSGVPESEREGTESLPTVAEEAWPPPDQPSFAGTSGSLVSRMPLSSSQAPLDRPSFEGASGSSLPGMSLSSNQTPLEQPASESTSEAGGDSVDAVPGSSVHVSTREGEAAPNLVPVKVSVLQSLSAERIFSAESIPHLNGLWVYITTLGWLIANTDFKTGMQMPSLPIPFPVTLDQLLFYNGLGLVVLAMCGVGIFVSRRPLEVLRRLGLVKPTGMQVVIGLGMVAVTFLYDYLWSNYTHAQTGMGYAQKLSGYNEGTFQANGADAGSAFVLALAVGVFAGVGEETLIRGALQPVFGILPAGFLHGALHGQFNQAPMYILQVALWSVMLGVVRRYTNTTTTIICHFTYNFLCAFLFAFNP